MTVVDTASGAVRGSVLGNGVRRFLGIPYAEPPIGVRRWLPPVTARPCTEVRDAYEYGLSAPQASNRGPFDPVGATSEDCLFLNIWTPCPNDGRRPVLVWIHGGGLRGGSASEAASDGASFAANGDCVVVSLNYRLGALGGFIHLSALDHRRLGESANLGLLDQLLALEWVRDNITGFGGDPAQVTVAGQSSGGQSIAMLMSMPRARGLFRRAIVQSPAPTTLPEAEVSAWLAERYVAHLAAAGIDRDAVADAPVNALIWAQATLKKETDWGPIGHPLNPVLDGAVLARQPLVAIGETAEPAVPLIVGSTRDELIQKFGIADTEVTDRDSLAAVWQRVFPGVAPDGRPIAERMAAAYDGEALRHVVPQASSPVALVQADKTVRIGAIRLAEAVSATQPATFMYLFDWRSPTGLGSPHCIDIPFVFGTAATSALGELTGKGPEVAEMTRRVQGAWIAFVRDATPCHDGLAHWPRYGRERRSTLLLGACPAVVDDPWGAQRTAWDGC